MKKLVLFIVLISTIGIFANNKAMAQDRPYYILFSNLEDRMSNGEGVGSGVGDYHDANTEITNLDTLLFLGPVLSRDEWRPWTTYAPFSPSTFSQWPITSFDWAFFPMGEYGLDYSVGGIRVIDKINEMIDAGKDIIIMGYNWLGKASSDPDVNKFVTETLGIVPEKVSLMDKNTFVGFDVFGSDTSMITQGGSFHANGGYSRNGSPVQWPMRLYRECDMFTVKSGSSFFPFHSTTAFGGTKYVGGLTNVGKSTIAVWSIDWANISGSTFDAIEYPEKALIERFLSDTPKPEPYLQSQYNEISMGSCAVGDSLYYSFVIKNFGRKPLIVTDVKFSNQDLTCFTLMKVPTSFTLEPDMQKKIMIRFKPTEEDDFSSDIVIVSNASNCSDKKFYIPVEATGGEKMNYGANLSITSYPIDFGKIMTGKISFADVEITNTGQAILQIDSVFFTDKNQKDFIYADVYKMPQVVIPGNTYTQRIKFIPLIENHQYTTKMKIVTNGYNEIKKEWGRGIGYVTLVGETFSDKAGPDMVLSVKELLFGQRSKKTDTTITIRNLGDLDLLVQLPEFNQDCNNELEAPFSFSPAEIPLIRPGDEFNLTVSFNPPRDKEYYCILKLMNNSSNPSKAKTEIEVIGEGKGTSVEGDNPQNIFDVNVTPNPISENSEINLSIHDSAIKYLDITLVDMLGKEVMNLAHGNYSKGDYRFDLNRNKLAAGKYLLIVSYGRTTENVSVIVK